ncbi:MAG: hypothetical protein A2284_00615 [Deltaproteobacteria bacterium RIFOXYA12_FULL_61_11]|nr:MAG: hypothetical protein A2284_00615 [Deltaproteobacteria bacterium RIFOXYA12_FULL_61_11]
MLVTCRICNTRYEIPPNIVATLPRPFQCASCGSLFNLNAQGRIALIENPSKIAGLRQNLHVLAIPSDPPQQAAGEGGLSIDDAIAETLADFAEDSLPWSSQRKEDSLAGILKASSQPVMKATPGQASPTNAAPVGLGETEVSDWIMELPPTEVDQPAPVSPAAEAEPSFELELPSTELETLASDPKVPMPEQQRVSKATTAPLPPLPVQDLGEDLELELDLDLAIAPSPAPQQSRKPEQPVSTENTEELDLIMEDSLQPVGFTATVKKEAKSAPAEKRGRPDQPPPKAPRKSMPAPEQRRNAPLPPAPPSPKRELPVPVPPTTEDVDLFEDARSFLEDAVPADNAFVAEGTQVGVVDPSVAPDHRWEEAEKPGGAASRAGGVPPKAPSSQTVPRPQPSKEIEVAPIATAEGDHGETLPPSAPPERPITLAETGKTEEKPLEGSSLTGAPETGALLVDMSSQGTLRTLEIKIHSAFNAIYVLMISVFLAILVSVLLLFRGTLFPALAEARQAGQILVRQFLPTFQTSGVEAKNQAFKVEQLAFLHDRNGRSHLLVSGLYKARPRPPIVTFYTREGRLLGEIEAHLGHLDAPQREQLVEHSGSTDSIPPLSAFLLSPGEDRVVLPFVALLPDVPLGEVYVTCR